MSTLTPELRNELGDLQARFARCLDRHDYSSLRSIFTANVRYKSPSYDCYSIEELVSGFEGRRGSRITRHCLGLLLLTEAVNGTVLGDGTWQTWASNDPHATGPVSLYLVADFHDRFVSTTDGWRIAERVITPVFRDPALAPRNV